MHIYFSGIGGTGIGPLSLIAKEAGYEVSGSDKQDSQYIEYLKAHGVSTIHIGQSAAALSELHQNHPIDWLVYSSAVSKENADHPELRFAKEAGIRISKRDELLNQIITDKQLKLVAIAGTHGKTTTTAMTIWLLQQLGLKLSYSVGAKISFGEMGHYEEGSTYFVYEADEYDRNFLAFSPYLSLITGVTWDHQDVFSTEADYLAAFRQFVAQSTRVVVWQSDLEKLVLSNNAVVTLHDAAPEVASLHQAGHVNRRNAWQAIRAVHELTKTPLDELIELSNAFPGVARRFEKLADNLYSDYAHTYEKIKGAIGVALETNQNVCVVYEGLHNRRQHFMLEQGQFTDLFDGVQKVYWVPSYLAREDPTQDLLTPKILIEKTGLSTIAEPALPDATLKETIRQLTKENTLVLCLSAGGGGSLDEWLRKEFTA